MQSNVVVVAIDGWQAASIGPYGNTMVETPALNRLAAQSLLFDCAMDDSVELASIYHSYWSGQHAVCRARAESDVASPTKNWLHGLSPDARRTILATDSDVVADHELAGQFHEKVLLGSPQSVVSAPAGSLEETSLARFFEQLIQTLGERTGSSDAPWLAWCHSRGMTGPWDAPYEMRLAHVDDEDPDPPRFVEPPELQSENGFDPDEQFGIQAAYAAQIEVLDACLGALLESLASVKSNTSVVVLGVRGYPLGSHGRIGLQHPLLYSDVLSVPLLVRPATSLRNESGSRYAKQMPVRSPAIIQPHQMGEAIADLFGLGGPDEDTEGRGWVSYLRELTDADMRYRLGWEESESLIDSQPNSIAPLGVAVAPQQRAIRTPSWFARFTDDHAQLYTKPDDRFEVNEVADRGVEELEQLRTLANEYAQNNRVPRVPADLCKPHE